MVFGKTRCVFQAALITLKTPISNGALKGDLPSRLKLLNWGENPSVKGAVKVSEISARELPIKQLAAGYDRIALDFEHNTVPGAPEYERTKEPREVAAYGTPRIVANEGLFLEDVQWTPAGKRDALNFADLSPAVQMDDAGNIVFIHSSALTRNGAVEGLSFFNVTLSAEPSKKESGHDSAPAGYPKDKDKYADPKNFKYPLDTEEHVRAAWSYINQEKNRKGYSAEELKFMEGRIKAAAKKCGIEISDDNKTETHSLIMKDVNLTLFSIATLLGLPDTTAEADVLAELKKRLDLEGRIKTLETAGNKAIATLSATIDGKVHTFSAEDVVKLVTRLDALEKKFTDSETANVEAERGKIILLFAADGKVPKKADGGNYSAEELKKLDVGTLRLLHVNTPVTVPLSARNSTSQTDGGGKRYKDDKGRVDLSAIFNDENARNGQARPAMA